MEIKIERAFKQSIKTHKSATQWHYQCLVIRVKITKPLNLFASSLLIYLGRVIFAKSLHQSSERTILIGSKSCARLKWVCAEPVNNRLSVLNVFPIAHIWQINNQAVAAQICTYLSKIWNMKVSIVWKKVKTSICSSK